MPKTKNALHFPLCKQQAMCIIYGACPSGSGDSIIPGGIFVEPFDYSEQNGCLEVLIQHLLD